MRLPEVTFAGNQRVCWKMGTFESSCVTAFSAPDRAFPAQSRARRESCKNGGWRCAKEWYCGSVRLLNGPCIMVRRERRHDRSPAVVAWVENSTFHVQARFVALMLPCKTRVHDRNRLLCVGIINREIAPFKIFSPGSKNKDPPHVFHSSRSVR